MKNKTKKRLIYVAITLFILTLILSYGVGSYFVNYALMPNMGAEDRDVTTELIETNNPVEATIEENREIFEVVKDEWLIEVENQTETVAIQSHDDLTLVGHEFTQPVHSDKWVIILHGYQADEQAALNSAPYFYNDGYNVLTVNLRAHGSSQGDYIGMGELDRYDLKSWTEYLIDKNPDSQIIHHGTSMGAATVLLASELDMPENVTALIADSSYTSIWDIFASELDERFGLPTFPILDLARLVAIPRAGYDLQDGNVIEAVGNSYTPTLFIHGTNDDFVPFEMGAELFEAKAGSEKEFLEVEGAGHAENHFAMGEEYYQSIFDFVIPYFD